MNYYDARQRGEDGPWDFTCRNDDRIWAVGFCARRVPCECGTIETAYRPKEDCENCGGHGWVDNPNYCGSHETVEEARACFRSYLLADISEESYGEWTGCAAYVNGQKCDKPTKQGLETRPPLGESFALCDEHRTFECLRFLAAHDAGQITASY